MHVNCLHTQEGFFETRLLRRVFEPVFVDAAHLELALDAPLVLYGQWQPPGLQSGLRWLADLAYKLPHPCIVLPPFESGPLSESLGLATQLNAQGIDANFLSILPDAAPLNLGDRQTLQIQTDYAFAGQAGKHWLAVGDLPLAALALIQPKNTATPLLLCGARLLSASGLSNDEDRLALLKSIVAWAWGWQPIPDPKKKEPITSERLDEAIWHVICIVLAGSFSTSPREIISLTSSLFAVELSAAEMQLAIQKASENNLAEISGDTLKVDMKALETYTQQNGLWAYVRALRKDFERKQMS